MNKKDVDSFEKLQSQLEGLYDEIVSWAKKAPNDAVNKFKLKFINKVLSHCNNTLTKSYRPFEDFEAFSDEELPTNSDVTFILLQYLNCMDKLRSDNIYHSGFDSYWYWLMDGSKTNLRTAPPKKIKDK